MADWKVEWKVDGTAASLGMMRAEMMAYHWADTTVERWAALTA